MFSSEPGLDMSSLARAAVAGDERALDLFSSWRPKTGRRGGLGPGAGRENTNFYVGSVSGVIYYLNENGSCMEVLQADGAIRSVLPRTVKLDRMSTEYHNSMKYYKYQIV